MNSLAVVIWIIEVKGDKVARAVREHIKQKARSEKGLGE
jgi:hypothetical protein